MNHVNTVTLGVLLGLFTAVTVLGFLAARWRRAADPLSLEQWGLGGRTFGTWLTWFLLGGDLYTAYTFIAVPAVLFGAGAAGFFAVPYTMMGWPVIFVFGPRLWSVARRHGYVTPGDFVRGRYGSRTLALAVALTGILATMPYIALQLVGIQAVLDVAGIGAGSGVMKDLPLIVAFAVLAVYTFVSGLRAPVLIAFVKDALIYVTVIVAVIYIPYRLGGLDIVFHRASTALHEPNPATGEPKGSLLIGAGGGWAYGTLALGSALALFMYPHAMTGMLASRKRDVIRRNTAMLPLYSLLLGLIALLGYMALAAGIKPKDGNAQNAIPQLFATMFPSWFTGVAFAAIAIGALVPAAIMSIAAANLFTRNVYREYLRPDATPAQERRVSQIASLLVKVGAVAFVLGMDRTFAINFQLLGGIWILQTFPAIVFGLYTRWFHRWALLAGWAVAMLWGTWTAYLQPAADNPHGHFGSQVAPVHLLGLRLVDQKVYIAIAAFAMNLVVSTVLTLVLRALRVPAGQDETHPADFYAEAQAEETRQGEPGEPASELAHSG